MLPEQVNPSRTEDTARAPYNFVPLPEQLVAIDPQSLPDQDSYGAGRYSGAIECRLITETPLFVRAPLTLAQYQQLDAETEKTKPYTERVKNHPDFFFTDSSDRPRIPGSTLRGMLRSMVEMIGHSKFEDVTKHKLVYRAVGDTTSHGEHYRDQIMDFDEAGYDEQNKRFRAYTPKVKAGYLLQQNSEWFIQPAQTIRGTTFARVHHNLIERGLGKLDQIGDCRNASYLYIQPGPYEHQLIRGGHIRVRYAKVLRVATQAITGLVKGALVKSGEITSKRTEAVVFPLDPNAKRLEIKDQILSDYRDQVSQEQQKLLGEDGLLSTPAKDLGNDPADNFPIHRQPVFYILDENKELLFFGHTMMMRLPYENSPFDLVPDFLRRPEQIDLAEALFGYTKKKSKGKEQAYASRICVGDALLASDQRNVFLATDPITPKILASPKPTAFQHYLVQERPDPQEIGKNRAGEPVYQKFLEDYNASPEASTLRGYKLYWHKDGAVSLQDFQEPAERRNEKENRPVKGKEGWAKRDSQYTLMKPVKADVQFGFTLRFENLAKYELGALLWALSLPGLTGQDYRHKLGMGKAYGMGTVHLEPTLHLEDRQSRYSQLFAEQDGQFNWHTGHKVVGEGETNTDFIEAFERELLDRLGQRTLQHLHQLARIQVLFKLLAWPGRTQEDTRYMEIEHQHPSLPRGKVNEYKSRPVLPTPVQTNHAPRTVVAQRPAAMPAPARPVAAAAEIARREAMAADLINLLNRKNQSPLPVQPQSVQPQLIQPQYAQDISKPTAKEDIKPGMMLEGTVVRVEQEKSRVVIDIGVDKVFLVKQEVVPSVRNLAELKERFPANTIVQVWVKEISDRGSIQLTQRGIQA